MRVHCRASRGGREGGRKGGRTNDRTCLIVIPPQTFPVHHQKAATLSATCSPDVNGGTRESGKSNHHRTVTDEMQLDKMGWRERRRTVIGRLCLAALFCGCSPAMKWDGAWACMRRAGRSWECQTTPGLPRLDTSVIMKQRT